MMRLYDGCKEILKIQKFRRIVSYAGFLAFSAALNYAYTSNATRAGYSRADQFYASYPAGTELLTDAAKLYKAVLGNCFEEEEWGPIEWSIMAKNFERQGKSPYAYHAEPGQSINDSLSQIYAIWDQLSLSEPEWSCIADAQKFTNYRDQQRLIQSECFIS